jgi:hypothetical protein
VPRLGASSSGRLKAVGSDSAQGRPKRRHVRRAGDEGALEIPHAVVSTNQNIQTAPTRAALLTSLGAAAYGTSSARCGWRPSIETYLAWDVRPSVRAGWLALCDV